MTDGTSTLDIWFASLLSYLGYELAQVRIIDEKRAEWIFVCPSEDGKLIRESYDKAENGGETIFAKTFVQHFNALSRQQRDLRRREEVDWCGPAWIAGKIR